MDTPEISVVIPTRNEEASIDRVIDEVSTAMRGHGPYEIIVVDTDSTDRTTEIARNKGARVVPEPRRGYGRAYETGFAAAQGEVVGAHGLLRACEGRADPQVPPDTRGARPVPREGRGEEEPERSRCVCNPRLAPREAARVGAPPLGRLGLRGEQAVHHPFRVEGGEVLVSLARPDEQDGFPDRVRDRKRGPALRVRIDLAKDDGVD